MAQTVILHGKSQREFAKRLIDLAPADAVVRVTEAKRTLDQNSKLWAMLSDVSRAKPNGRCQTPEVWKALFMHACGHSVQFEMGLNGQPFPVGFSSSKLTKRQMADLIETIYQYGAENGVVWTEPDSEARAAA
ncbi:recombination protein NinB [Agrobacterium sp. ST15.13.015]|uniref:recombination protein NinB n=1 Tax=Agrobacterium sp. ST15.13.015 TaxID=3017319 RepID=UPI0022C6B206|nr:recombination protein NinB [Agrobacterium sp. ST15.13.015]MCZ7501989.1 recombination protein NinB [Rhizobium rhizogenes]